MDAVTTHTILTTVGPQAAEAVANLINQQSLFDNSFTGLLVNPRLYLLGLLGVLVTQAIMAFPMPNDNSSAIYTWFWKFTTGSLNAFRLKAHNQQTEAPANKKDT